MDYKLWLLEADRLGVEFSKEAVDILVQQELGGRDFFDLRLYNEAWSEVRWNNQNVTKALLERCFARPRPGGSEGPG